MRVIRRVVVLDASDVDAESSFVERSARVVRVCRRQGETVRNLIDCLIGEIAVREDVPVLHADTDFDVLARHTAVQIHPMRV